MNWTAAIVLFIFCSIPLDGAQRVCIAPGRGYFRIHVDTAGLFGAFAHDHSVEAKKILGCAMIDENDVTRSSIKLEFPAADIRVIDPKESEKDRAEVQRTMETEVLRVSEYPPILFESIAVERAGEYRFKQSSFQIKPVQFVGGTVKVKDELQTQFEIFLK